MTAYERWYRHFLDNNHGAGSLPWHGSKALDAGERKLVARAVQQFQLGEWARGRGLMRRAAGHRVLAADAWFLPAMKLFIAEEQGHSGLLGRFLDREGIPRLERHWIDGIFRRLRKLAGLEICVMVLATAEMLAIPFYQALRDSTRSQLLRSICRRILRDEAAHVEYQALTVGLARRALSGRARCVHAAFHGLLFHGTALLLWQQHERVFRAAGWDFRRFWNDARREFARWELRIERIARDERHAESETKLSLLEG